jgi:GntR family transcriptional regulator / MocR family aminotransferase
LPEGSAPLDPLFEIELDLSAGGRSGAAARTLHRQLKLAIVEGRLPAGAQLPATRRSADYFGLSRNTVAEVYDRLVNEGCVVTRRGSGTYVSDRVPAAATPAQAPHVNGHSHSFPLNAFWLRPDVASAIGFWSGTEARGCREAKSLRTSGQPQIDLRPAIVDSTLFPLDLFRRVSVKELRRLETKPARRKSPQGNPGHFPLRAAIAGHIALTRAVVCRPDDVLITSGAQQAFDLLARVLVTSGKTVVAVEDPGYPPMRIPFAAAGARVVPVAVDCEGLLVEQLPTDAGVICLCPSHQFPLGVTMSARRRSALLDFARRNGAVVIEDDYDGEFRYEGIPVEALRTRDAAASVFYVGTFSKCMLPMFRLGFIIAPDWAVPALVSAKNCLDWHCSTPLQMAVARFISDGHLARHVRRMRDIYRRRRQLVLKSLDDELGHWLLPGSSYYGLHVAALTRVPLDLDAITDTLGQANVCVHTLQRYYLGPQTHNGFVLGYGVADLAELRQGLSLLRKALLALA